MKKTRPALTHQLIGVHAHGGSAVEAEPAEPQDEHAQRGEGQVVAQDGPGLAVLAVLADAGPKDLGADQRADAADHVHGSGTGEVVEAQLSQPAAAPDPVAGDGVDEQRRWQRSRCSRQMNLVRSAMAPETMVAEVAQNTVWKMA